MLIPSIGETYHPDQFIEVESFSNKSYQHKGRPDFLYIACQYLIPHMANGKVEQ